MLCKLQENEKKNGDFCNNCIKGTNYLSRMYMKRTKIVSIDDFLFFYAKNRVILYHARTKRGYLMFLVGETDSTVHSGKVALPPEYRLKKKSLLIMWKDDRTCYLGETRGALKFAAGVESPITMVEIDSENRLPLGSVKDGTKVHIAGCVSTVELRVSR